MRLRYGEPELLERRGVVGEAAERTEGVRTVIVPGEVTEDGVRGAVGVQGAAAGTRVLDVGVRGTETDVRVTAFGRRGAGGGVLGATVGVREMGTGGGVWSQPDWLAEGAGGPS